ncbi:hypothetical protein HELRODRAFT_88788 [Helobdella robusta]|uniref:GP-PDE domain-containing protein n=1 Tax=Helobdella robusta TaxID=6412 RepID=T1G765_HELRO|nr:hypothetical protein HELRODRAFT_88788 [Helobdella robusta]ESN93429.1 hypothetical protein HELRODRAFT_88788 [Helobdella robusta]
MNENSHEIVGVVFINPGHDKIGFIDASVISLVGHCIGTWPIRYLCIEPLPNSSNNCSILKLLNSKINYFGLKKPLFIGHRGSGRTFYNGKKVNNILENTLDSFKNAYDKGIRIIEFDVVLTKENIPIVYHDYTTCIRVTAESNSNIVEKLRLPLQNLSYSDLSKYDFQLCNDPDATKDPSLYKLGNLFPKLESVFQFLPEDMIFNIEIKYCMKMKTGSLEDDLCYVEERNIFVNSILEVSFKNVKSRKIMFSSFDPDICCMLKAKQSSFPVMFLTQGTGIYSDFKDERTLTVDKAISFAVSESLYGVVPHTKHILSNLACIKMAHEKNLHIFTWGDDNNDVETIKTLIDNDVDGIILDNISVVNKFNMHKL